MTVADALAVSSDAFFYRLGEKFWEIDEHNASVDPALKGKSTLKDDLERFGFGTETGVQLPFEWPRPDSRRRRSRSSSSTGRVLGKNEVPRLLVGDNVQVAIGQGLMAATPLQLANAYSTIANGGFLYQPTIVKTIFDPLVPDLSPGMADLSQGRGLQVVRDAEVQGPVGDAAGDPRPDQQWPRRGHERRPRAQSRGHLSVELLPHHDRRESLPELPDERAADRRQDRHGAGRRQLPVERLVGVRARSASTASSPTRSSPTSRRAASAPRPRRRS